MKKIICLLIITVLLVGTASACADTGSSQPPPYPSFHFYSMEEFFAFFKMDTELGEIPAVYWNYGNDGKQVSEGYTAFINKMIAEPSIHVPTQDGEMISFYDGGEEFSKIVLSSAGGYNQNPDIWYYVLVENEMAIIEIEYLDAETAEFAKTNSCMEVLEKLSPNANKTSWGEKIYEKELALSDRKVSARVREWNDEDELFVNFVYDDILVGIQARPEIITDEWFGGLSFEEYTEETAEEGGTGGQEGGGERPLTTLQSYVAYEAYVQENQLTDRIVTYERVANIGDFCSLVFLSETRENDYSEYMYSLHDGFMDISLYVDHNIEDENETFAVSSQISEDSIVLSDMRALKIQETRKYVYHEIEYSYVSGVLSSVTWEDNGIYYTLAVDSTITEYPLDQSTFVAGLLKGSTVQATVATMEK